MLSLLKGDCLDLMKTLPAKSVDCFVCDLPYGCLTNTPHADGTQGKSKGGLMYSASTGCAWDIKIDLVQFWEQVKRLARNDKTPVLMFCNAKFGNDLINSNPKWFRYDLIWAKTNAAGFLSANIMPLRSHELIYVFSKKSAFYKREGIRCAKSVVEVANKRSKGQHPTAKPVELYEWLLTRYCPEGGTMLDPTAGSFNSCFVAKELGLKAIGIEKDEKFFWKGVSRL